MVSKQTAREAARAGAYGARGGGRRGGLAARPPQPTGDRSPSGESQFRRCTSSAGRCTTRRRTAAREDADGIVLAAAGLLVEAGSYARSARPRPRAGRGRRRRARAGSSIRRCSMLRCTPFPPASRRRRSACAPGCGGSCASSAEARSSRSGAARRPTSPASSPPRTCAAFRGSPCRRRSSGRWMRRSAARPASTSRRARTSSARSTGRSARSSTTSCSRRCRTWSAGTAWRRS